MFFQLCWWVSHFCPPVGYLVSYIFFSDEMKSFIMWGCLSHWVWYLKTCTRHGPTCTCRRRWIHAPSVTCCVASLWPHSLWGCGRSSFAILWPTHHLKSYYRTILPVLQLQLTSWIILSWTLCYLLYKPGRLRRSNLQWLSIAVNIESFDLSLLTLVSSWKASCWLLCLAAIISRDLDWILANSINVMLRSWPGMDPSVDR